MNESTVSAFSELDYQFCMDGSYCSYGIRCLNDLVAVQIAENAGLETSENYGPENYTKLTTKQALLLEQIARKAGVNLPRRIAGCIASCRQ